MRHVVVSSPRSRCGDMHLVRSAWVLVTAFGCGDVVGSNLDAPPLDAAPELDAPACAPAAPTTTVIASGGTELTQYVGSLTLTSSGEVAVFFYDGANGISAKTWENGTWTTHNVYTGASGSFGNAATSEIGGRPVY